MHPITKGAALTAVSLSLATPLMAQETTVMPPNGTTVVFVNTQAILPIAPGADSAQAAFQVVLQGFMGELQVLETEIDSLLAVYRQQEALLDEAGKAAKQEEIMEKQRLAQQRQAELETESDRRRNALLEPILLRVREVIDEIRGEHGYAMVFDMAESGVVAADPTLDITAVVLERLGIDPSVASAPSGN